jgi:mRNA interferase MazF
MNSNEVFDAWNHEKKAIHNDGVSRTYYVNEREIWFVKMGKNIGFEENGKEQFLRPVLVVKKVGNLFFTVALTSKGKNNSFYHKLESIELDNPKYQDSSFAILSQVKVMDKKRFYEKAGIVPTEEFNRVKQKIKTLLF